MGQNDWGKLGDGAYEPRATPVRVGGDFASVFAGPDGVVAIKRDGSLWSWRQTRSMQGERRGNSLSGSGFVTHMVRRIGEGFVHASAAGYGSGVVAVGEDGSLWAEYTPAVRPIPPATGDQGEQILDAFRLARVGDGFTRALVSSYGWSCVLGLKSDGTLLVWAHDPTWPREHRVNAQADRPARVGEGFVDLLEGNIARKADGSHWRLIVRPSHASPRTPQTRECYAEARRIENLPEGLGVKVLRHAGDTQFVAIDRAGGLWTWGEGYPRSAPLGDGAAVSRSTPVRIGTGFVDVSAQGTHHRVALRKDGSVWSWGAPFESWTSPPPGTFASPTVVGKGYRQVAAGPQHTLALGIDGRVRAWGYNSAGQVGIDAQTAVIDRPVRLQAGVVSVAAGRAHSLALRRDGTLVGWGANVCGQLGHADPAPSHHPVTLARRIRHIAAGEHASYAIATDGTLWRWGTESNLCRPDRQVGTPVPPGFGKPERLGTGFATIAANGRAVLFLDRDGRWWEPDDRAGSRLRELAARDHAQIVRSSGTYFGLGRDGTLQAWGGETSYDHPAFSRTLDQRAQPGVPLTIGHGYSAIAVSGEHALAIGQDGSLWAWGRNNRYQVGEGHGYWGPKAPVRIGTDVKAIAVSNLQSFTIRADGTLIAWGDTTLGQLGIGRSMPFRPVRVVFPDAREAQESSSPVITGAVR